MATGPADILNVGAECRDPALITTWSRLQVAGGMAAGKFRKEFRLGLN